MPEAPGTRTVEGAGAVIDFSNAPEGYVMARFPGESDRRLKLRVACPTGALYTYDLYPGDWAAFPLSEGAGDYTVTLYRHTGVEDGYTTLLTAEVTGAAEDPFGPFLLPNQQVNYEDAPQTVALAGELGDLGLEGTELLQAACDMVTERLQYDRETAAEAPKGYLADLDGALAAGKGICLDYAALMTALLRCQGVPCKLIVGYYGESYHAWVSAWDGTDWRRMDPTFADREGGAGEADRYTQRYAY